MLTYTRDDGTRIGLDFEAIKGDETKLGELLLKKLDEIHNGFVQESNQLCLAAIEKFGDLDSETKRQEAALKESYHAVVLGLVEAYYHARVERFFSHRHEFPPQPAVGESSFESLLLT